VLGGAVLLHVYLWKRLVSDTTSTGGLTRRVLTGVLVALVLVMVSALALGTRTDPAVARWFAWPGYLWLALCWYLLLILLVLELPRLALRRWVRRESDPRPTRPTGPGTPRRNGA
jgi:hypothetical protein